MLRYPLQKLAAVIAGLTITLVVGCAKPSLTADVEGTVTFRGEPLSQGTIVFQPMNGRPAYGEIVDGSIQNVHTFESNDGALVGEHKVAVQAMENTEENDPYAVRKPLVPNKYLSPETSGIVVVIEAGKTNNIRIDLNDAS